MMIDPGLETPKIVPGQAGIYQDSSPAVAQSCIMYNAIDGAAFDYLEIIDVQ